MKLTISPAPHIKSCETTSSIMTAVIFALLPAGVWGVVKFGIHSLYVILVSVAGCVFFEYVSQKYIFKKKVNPASPEMSLRKGGVKIGDRSAVLTGLLMAYCLAPDIPLWQVLVGSFFAIFIAKECFGGIGFNIFNPALVGRAVLLASFPTVMTTWQIDGITCATPLGILKEKLAVTMPSNIDLFLGNIPGSIGEISKLFLIIGAAYLFIRKIISWHIPLTYILTVLIVSIFFKQDPVFQILSGGVILGAFFMATDYVTSPLYFKGKIIFGFGCGLLTVLIRNLGSYPEGVCYAILIMNILSPLLDRYTKPRVFGTK